MTTWVTTIKVRYPEHKDDKVMEEVRKFAKALKELGIECKGDDIITSAE